MRKAHRRTPLGVATVTEWNQFWLDLQEFVAILHKRYLDPQHDFYLNAVAQISDADQLVQALRESTYFRVAPGLATTRLSIPRRPNETLSQSAL